MTAQNDISIISPNMIKLFLECPRKFYFQYIEQIPSPHLDKNFVAGKNIHSAASYYLNGGDIAKFEQVLTPTEKEYWSVLKSNPYYNFEVIGIEKKITMRLGEFWIGGRIDAIVRNNNDYYILDYKTGGVKKDMIYDPQTMVYLLMCDELYSCAGLTFVYLDLKNNSEVKILLTDSLKAEYKSKLSDLCVKIQDFNIKKTVFKQGCCCEYLSICEFL